MLIKPTTLRPGARLAVIAPAGPLPDRSAFDKGLAILRQRYEVVHTDAIFAQHRYFAGDDAHRLRELLGALGDPSIDGIVAARGGYGVMRLLPRLDPERFVLKPIIGFSDITTLHLAWQATQRVTFHAPVIAQLPRLRPVDLERLFSVLEQPGPAAPLSGSQTYVPGVAEGPLLGGNLSVMTRLLGTPYWPSMKGAVLLIEDVGEKPYRLDRMWTHLRLAGVFDQLAGIVLGEFTGCDEPAPPAHTSADILIELARETGVPCAAGFEIGHGSVNLTVPLGVRVRLDATARSLSFLEPHATS